MQTLHLHQLAAVTGGQSLSKRIEAATQEGRNLAAQTYFSCAEGRRSEANASLARIAAVPSPERGALVDHVRDVYKAGLAQCAKENQL